MHAVGSTEAETSPQTIGKLRGFFLGGTIFRPSQISVPVLSFWNSMQLSWVNEIDMLVEHKFL